MLVLLLTAGGVAAQDTANVEVDPVTCWWRTGASSVRVGQPFSLILTCAALETAAAKAVIDRGRLAASAVQLPPYEVVGGTQSEDLTTPSRRFMQYEYTLRLIGDDVFGQDVPIPPLQISYRIESKVQQDGAIQGREQTYILPPLSQHLASLVPANASHIREAPVIGMSGITAREARGNLMRSIGGILFGLSGLVLVVALVRAFQKRRGAVIGTRTRFVSDSAILHGVRRELRDVQQQGTREGWSPALLARALAALRVSGSYAAGQAVAQRPSNGKETREGWLVVNRSFGLGSPVLVSGAATARDVAANGAREDLRGALSTLTVSRYGRNGELDTANLNDAVESGLRATSHIAAEHTWMAETLRGARRAIGRWNPRTWER